MLKNSVPTTEIDDMVPNMSKVFTADTLQRVACHPPRGRPEPEVWWERGGQRVPTEGRVYQDGLNLVFSPTEGGDSGTYTCVAQNRAGRRTQEVTFTVASESNTHRCMMFTHYVCFSLHKRTKPLLYNA